MLLFGSENKEENVGGGRRRRYDIVILKSNRIKYVVGFWK